MLKWEFSTVFLQKNAKGNGKFNNTLSASFGGCPGLKSSVWITVAEVDIKWLCERLVPCVALHQFITF